MTPEGQTLLLTGLAELGIAIDAPQTTAFSTLLQLLQDGNARLNLTALKTESDIILKHFIDSATCLRGGHLGDDDAVVDLGTGAGFPALPMAILRPQLRITPVDATRKKIDFVRATAARLELHNVSPVVGRAESLGRDPAHRVQYDCVVVRAVAALPVLVELALPLLKVGGRLVAQKGHIDGGEIEAGQSAAEAVGGRLTLVDSFTLPIAGDARTLVVIEKDRPTPETYPRREGVPARQPLFWATK